MKQRPDSRRGAILVIVLACIVLTAGVIGNLVRQTVLTHQQSKLEFAHSQLNVLADDALAYAIQKHAQSGTVPKETWTISREEWDLNYEGRVEISSMNQTVADDSTAESIIQVQALLFEGEEVIQQLTRSYPLTTP
ncbi:MAG TPA: hypothetical protein DD473_13325 [Planctomycetaceae bacterium]|nr:hypothetical protein [Planctomycetaceae bacterium]|tara:strand:- start:18 stop:425 length:408 start_codon:yes stop_codon:yes gene_type:complete